MPGIILAHADILQEGVPGDITSCNQHTGTSLHSSSCVVFAVTAFGGPRGASSVCAGYDYIPLVHRSCVATLRTNDVWLNKLQGHQRIQFRGWTITDCLHKQSMPHNHSLPGGPPPWCWWYYGHSHITQVIGWTNMATESAPLPRKQAIIDKHCWWHWRNSWTGLVMFWL